MDSDLDEVKFVDCPYCEKFFDSDNFRSINTHVQKVHADVYETYKENFPQHFAVEQKETKAIPRATPVSTNHFDDYRSQIDDESRPFVYQCEVCLFKFRSRSATYTHINTFHAGLAGQIGNTITHLDPQLHQETVDKFSFKYRCSICLTLMTNGEPAYRHLERHTEEEKKMYMLKNTDYRKNLEKLLTNTEIAKDWKIKYYKVDPVLSEGLEKEKVKDEAVNYYIPEEEYKVIIGNLEKINKAKLTTGNVKNYYEQTLDALKNYYENSRNAL